MGLIEESIELNTRRVKLERSIKEIFGGKREVIMVKEWFYKNRQVQQEKYRISR